MARRSLHRWLIAGLLTAPVAGTLAGRGLASAQELPVLPEPASSTPARAGADPELAVDTTSEIDLANVVTSAAKGVTTVQEAPAIITVITAEDIKSRGFKFLGEALATVPGWLDSTELGNQVAIPYVRGVLQAVLTLHDGISLFDPWANIPWMTRTQPLENLKRIEVVTGPGGVLWGANSFLGIVNMITKDAEDVNGVEASAGYGDGRGNRQDLKAYALFGKTFWHGKLKIFQHVSYESYIGSTFAIPQLLALGSAPNPGGPGVYGPVKEFYPPRTSEVIVDGKYTLGPVSLYYALPFGNEFYAMSVGSAVAPHDQWTAHDRYGILEYKGRFWKERVGLTAKGYYTQFIRDFTFQLLPESSLFPAAGGAGGHPPGGGLRPTFTHFIQRYGGTVDVDVTLPHSVRLLAGGELFYEGISDSTLSFESPQNPSSLPVFCPLQADGTYVPGCLRRLINDANRIVGSLYADAQWRPVSRLTLDGGIRVQKGWGSRPYDYIPLYSIAAVWNFLPSYFAKANYATGFRPPVFNATDVAPGALSFGANPNLRTESSQSFQGELNGRVLRNVRKVRELEMRLDYSYTALSDIIQIKNQRYGNSGNRAIHSVEAYGKLFLVGDHFLQASYTYLNSRSTDLGQLRNMPNHWFTIGGVFNLVEKLLDVNVQLNVLGAYEDPNRHPGVPASIPDGTTTARLTDLGFDRLTPVALLQLGVRLRLYKDQIAVSAQFYNVLDQHYWYPDGFNDLAPTAEVHPNPAPGFNAFASVSYHPRF